jgi:hypothetical protein
VGTCSHGDEVDARAVVPNAFVHLSRLVELPDRHEDERTHRQRGDDGERRVVEQPRLDHALAVGEGTGDVVAREPDHRPRHEHGAQVRLGEIVLVRPEKRVGRVERLGPPSELEEPVHTTALREPDARGHPEALGQPPAVVHHLERFGKAAFETKDDREVVAGPGGHHRIVDRRRDREALPHEVEPGRISLLPPRASDVEEGLRADVVQCERLGHRKRLLTELARRAVPPFQVRLPRLVAEDGGLGARSG